MSEYSSYAEVERENISEEQVFDLIEDLDADHHFRSGTVWDYPESLVKYDSSGIKRRINNLDPSELESDSAPQWNVRMYSYDGNNLMEIWSYDYRDNELVRDPGSSEPRRDNEEEEPHLRLEDTPAATVRAQNFDWETAVKHLQ